MPILHLEMWKGKSPETKRALAESLVRAVVAQLGCPDEVVSLVIDEVEPSNWYIGEQNGEASEADRASRARHSIPH